MNRLGAHLLALALTFVSCATVPPAVSRTIQVTRECLVTAGQDVLPQAIIEVETALANPTIAGATAALTSLGAQYSVAAVSCLVDKIVHESTVNYARSNGTDPISATKISNGRAWLHDHPSGQ